MSKISFFFCMIVYFFVIGCSTSQVQMDHKKYEGPKANNPVFSVGQFEDSRKHGSHWLGAIRGGFGNPLKTLETPKPVKDVVRDAFQDALKQRGIYAHLDNAKYILNVDVLQYDCNQYVRKEAHIKLNVIVVDSTTNKEVFSDYVVVDNVEGSIVSMKAGIFGSVEELKNLAEKTLTQAVNEVLRNPSLRRLYQQRT